MSSGYGRSGTTPSRLIKEERLRIARERLRCADFASTITDLANRLHFSSVGAFSNAFRERYGMRPRDLR